MSSKQPGKLVWFWKLGTADGGKSKDATKQYGRTYNKDNAVNGKIVVYYLTEDYKHILENGEPMKRLVDVKKLNLIGFID